MAIPDDLQIIGFDGISLTEMMYPSITTVAQPIYEMGENCNRVVVRANGRKCIGRETLSFTD